MSSCGVEGVGGCKGRGGESARESARERRTHTTCLPGKVVSREGFQGRAEKERAHTHLQHLAVLCELADRARVVLLHKERDLGVVDEGLVGKHMETY